MAFKKEIILDNMHLVYNRYGVYHKTDGPAIIYPSGTKKWYQYGLFHRDDGPAIIWSDGEIRWYLRGELQ
jgi:hypothetical protein